MRPHLDQIAEWLRVKLIYPHEAARLTSAYRALEAREDDWIVASRTLSYSQIALYLGAFFLLAGSLFYFVAHRVEGAITGLTGPILILGLPFAGLNLAGRWLYRREHQAVAVAFYLGGLTLLPLFLLIMLHERGLWVAPTEAAHQLFTDATVSNRQLQITVGVTGIWATWLALRTRTSALSTVSAFLLFLFAVAVFADFGLRHWIEDGHYDLVALHLALLVPVYGASASLLERSGRPWFARPAYVAGALTLIGALDLFALNGKMLHYAGVSMGAFQPPDVADPRIARHADRPGALRRDLLRRRRRAGEARSAGHVAGRAGPVHDCPVLDARAPRVLERNGDVQRDDSTGCISALRSASRCSAIGGSARASTMPACSMRAWRSTSSQTATGGSTAPPGR